MFNFLDRIFLQSSEAHRNSAHEKYLKCCARQNISSFISVSSSTYPFRTRLRVITTHCTPLKHGGDLRGGHCHDMNSAPPVKPSHPHVIGYEDTFASLDCYHILFTPKVLFLPLMTHVSKLSREMYWVGSLRVTTVKMSES